MARSKTQIGHASQRIDELQVLSDGLRARIERVVGEPGDATQVLPTTVQARHIEQMYQLADIFASIFDGLYDAPDAAIATTRKAS